MPNGEVITSTHTALLPCTNIPLAARKAHIFPGLKTALLSIGTFCDHGCTATFTQGNVTITNTATGTVLMKGRRCPQSRLYMLKLNNNQQSVMTEQPFPEIDCANNVHECTSKQNLVDYLHASAWSPTTSGWKKAISKGFFTTWPGLTNQLVQKYLSKKEATVYGHLKQNRKGLRSTSTPAHAQTPAPPSTEEDNNQFPEPKHSMRTHDVFAKVIHLEGKIYTDQTGRFPVTSSRGHKYICCAYDIDSNTIHAEPMRTKTGTELTTTYQRIQNLLSERGLTPKLHILDN